MIKLPSAASESFIPRWLLRCLLAVLLGAVGGATAATRTWDGSSSANWNLDANWAGNVKPVDGDDLVFPAGAARLTLNNDFAKLHVNSITFSSGINYALRGNPLTVTNGIANSSAGIDSIELAVTCAGNQAFSCPNASAYLYFRSNVVLSASTVTNSGSGMIVISGVISGTGGLVKTGTGTLSFQGAADNTYSGTTTVKGGLLELIAPGFNAIPAGLSIGVSGSAATVREYADFQIVGDVTVNSSGVLDVNGHNDTIGALTILGGDVTTGVGTLTLAGNLTAGNLLSSVSTITGHLSLGTASRTINVVGSLNAPGNELLMAASIAGSAGVGFNKIGGGTLRLNSGNSYSGVTTVSGGVLQVNSPTALGTTSSGTVLAGGRLEIITGLTIANEPLTNSSTSSVLELLAGAAPVVWSGNVVLNADLDVAVVSGNRLELSGVVSGSGGIYKELPGVLTLSGNSANTYTGTTVVGEGVLDPVKSSVIAVSGPLVIGDGTGVASVVPEANNQIGNVPVIINGGFLDMGAVGTSDTIGSLTLSNGFVATGGGILTLGGNVTNRGSSKISGKLSLGGVTRYFDVASYLDDLSVTAIISDGGASAGLTQTGTGVLRLAAANTFSGLTTIYGDAYLYNNSALGGSGSAASGTLVATNASIHPDSVDVGNEFLTLQEGSFWHGVGSGSWSGPITLAGNATVDVELVADTYTFSGAISGSGGFRKDLNGTLVLSGTAPNTYAGTTVVNYGTLLLAKSVSDHTIVGPLVIGTPFYASNSAVVRFFASKQIADNAPVTVNHSGLLDLAGYSDTFGAFSGDGNVTLGGGTLLNVNADGSSSTFSGLITGAGSLSKNGFGTLTLTGNNTYNGPTAAFAGTLLVNGSQPQSPALAYATLGGSGSVGDTTIIDGKVAPGNSPGTLTCNNLLVSGSGLFAFELNGSTPGSGYDQLKVKGTVNLGAQIANLSVTLGYASALSNSFTIIDNDGADAVTGIFNGLPEGSIQNISGTRFKLSYIGGTGNDVVLTQIEPWQQPGLKIQPAASGNVVLSWPKTFTGYTLESSTNLAGNTWAPMKYSLAVIGADNVVTTSAAGVPQCYRLRAP